MSVGEIILAPMEGVLDYPLREALTDYNRYDYCVSEFIRVTDVIFPNKVFRREVPELKNDGRTRSGTPVWVQILGTDPDILAGNALVAARCGAPGVDLNFGCPSKFVHRSGGGAAMLKKPAVIGEAVRKTRDLLPADVPLSVKIRLGWENPDDIGRIYEEIVNAGADRIIIHARTRMDGYRADAIKWEYIAPLADRGEITLVANGEVRDAESAARCMEVTHCDNLMVGRYALAVPNLEGVIRNGDRPFTVTESVRALIHFVDIMKNLLPEQYQMARTKQFLSYVRLSNPEVNLFFREICQTKSQADIDRILDEVVSGKRELTIRDTQDSRTGDDSGTDAVTDEARPVKKAHERYCRN
jgi:tRNA-dihydrouridine synthase C